MVRTNRKGLIRSWSWGLVNAEGREVVPTRFDEISTNGSEGYWRFREGAKWGFFDRAGKVVVPARYKRLDEVSEGLARVENGGLVGYLSLPVAKAHPPTVPEKNEPPATPQGKRNAP